jgi:hypothetical protein
VPAAKEFRNPELPRNLHEFPESLPKAPGMYLVLSWNIPISTSVLLAGGHWILVIPLSVFYGQAWLLCGVKATALSPSILTAGKYLSLCWRLWL